MPVSPSRLQEGFSLGALGEVLGVGMMMPGGVLGLWPWHMQLDTKYPGRCIPECQGHLVAHLGVQAKPVDAQVEHGEGADGGDWIAANVVHDHQVEQVAKAGEEIIIINVIIHIL